MISTLQTQEQNMLAHGLSVNDWLEDILSWLIDDSKLKHSWKLPQCLVNDKQRFRDMFITSLHKTFNGDAYASAKRSLQRYVIFHDCGKPSCITYNETGKHFPAHEKVSAMTWVSLGGSVVEARLMSMDMLIHTIKAEDVNEFVKLTEAPILMLVGLCEIHSNAKMFGGVDSQSFKIKHSRLSARWKKIMSITFNTSS